jgi:hypothetical protein
MSTFSVLNVSLVLEDAPADVTQRLGECTEPASMIKFVSRKLHSAGSGMQRARLTVRNDSAVTGSSQEAGEYKSSTVAITQASLVDTTDTLVFGGAVTLTWKTSASGENQVAIGSSNTEAGDNLVAKINAHSILGGVFFASNASGTVTIQYRGDPRIGSLIALTETGNGQVITGTTFASDVTDAKSSEAFQFSTMGVVS